MKIQVVLRRKLNIRTARKEFENTRGLKYSLSYFPFFSQKTVLMMIKLIASHRNIGVQIIKAQPKVLFHIYSFHFTNFFLETQIYLLE